MSRSFFKMNDGDLMVWAKSISGTLMADPARFDVSPAMAEALQLASARYAAARAAWMNPPTRTPLAMTEKAEARRRLLDAARYVVAAIRNNPATTEAQLDELGIPLRKKPTRRPPPESSPLIEVERVDGVRVSIRLRPRDPGRRGRPEGVASAGIYVAAGEARPEHASGWAFRGLTSRTRLVVDFPASASAGTVWISAKWFNARGEAGEASRPTRVNLPAVEAVPEGNMLKMAA